MTTAHYLSVDSTYHNNTEATQTVALFEFHIHKLVSYIVSSAKSAYNSQ